MKNLHFYKNLNHVDSYVSRYISFLTSDLESIRIAIS